MSWPRPQVLHGAGGLGGVRARAVDAPDGPVGWAHALVVEPIAPGAPATLAVDPDDGGGGAGSPGARPGLLDAAERCAEPIDVGGRAAVKPPSPLRPPPRFATGRRAPAPRRRTIAGLGSPRRAR